MGQAVTVLGSADPYLIDETNSVDVQLTDVQQWLTSCDEDALADGANLALVGSELVQFGDAAALGQGRFRLSRLLRGRGGSEWVADDHCAGELFCLIDGNALQPLPLPAWLRGSLLTVADRKGSSASLTFGAEAVRPLAPESLSAEVNASGDLAITWLRRSRAGLGWLDEVDAPVGEGREQYSVTISATAAEIELTTDAPAALLGAAVVASLGAGPAMLEVRQLGDWAASRPAQLTIDLP